MPALTHGRVKNGFNLLPRRNVGTCVVKKCDGCEKTQSKTAPSCKITRSMHNSRVNHYSSSSKKRANPIVSVGRSAAARRAIMRRATPNNTTAKNNKSCCEKEKCVCK